MPKCVGITLCPVTHIRELHLKIGKYLNFAIWQCISKYCTFKYVTYISLAIY